MKKRKIVFVLLLTLALTACNHEHTWVDATCTTARTCTRCGAREGEPLPHNWRAATCTEPKTCQDCGLTTGAPKKHDLSDWETVTPATCTSTGLKRAVCADCGAVQEATIPTLAHQMGEEWVVIQEATAESKGTRAKYCQICGEAEEQTYELTAAEKEALFKESCNYYTYNEIARNPDKYVGEKAVFTGQVIQTIEDGSRYNLRVDVTPTWNSWTDRFSWADTVYVYYTKRDSSEGRILEDDIITMYGELTGTTTYETVMGASVTIPAMVASYIEIEEY